MAHHFGTRDALLQAALEWAAEQSIGISLLEPATGSLDDLAAGLADLVREDAGMQAFQYELALEARRRPELLPAVERMYGAYIEATRRELMRLGLDEPTDDLARAVFALLDGIVLQQTLFGDAAATDRPSIASAGCCGRRVLHDTQARLPASDHGGMDDGPRDLYDTLDPDRGAELRRRNQARLAELEASSHERRARLAMLRALMASDAEVV